MWGFGNSAYLKHISTYAQAKERFKNTVPIRGRSEECRPLGDNRRYNGYTINKNMRAIDDGVVGQWQETYSAKVYSANVMEWYPDGKLAIRLGRWHGTIVQSVVNYTLCDKVGTIQSFNGKWYFHNKDGNAYYIPRHREQELLIDTESTEVFNPIQEYRRKTKRKEMNEVRKRYANFIEYGTNMLKISVDAFKFDEEEAKSVLGKNNVQFSWGRWSDPDEVTKSRTRFLKNVDKFEQSGDLTVAYNLASIVVKAINYWGDTATSDQFKKFFDEILKHQYRNEVFESEPVEIGKPFFDRNAKYFY